MNIEIPMYDDSNLRDRIDDLEIRIKKLEGYRLKLKSDLKPYQIGYLLGSGNSNESDLLRQGVYEWEKK